MAPEKVFFSQSPGFTPFVSLFWHPVLRHSRPPCRTTSILVVHPRRSICIVNTVTVESQYIHKMVHSSSSPRNPKPPSSELCTFRIELQISTCFCPAGAFPMASLICFSFPGDQLVFNGNEEYPAAEGTLAGSSDDLSLHTSRDVRLRRIISVQWPAEHQDGASSPIPAARLVLRYFIERKSVGARGRISTALTEACLSVAAACSCPSKRLDLARGARQRRESTAGL
ncbi:hypothetical protein V8D89_007407 [Ganoderma adspersum]